ncbi:hypothetical protein MVEN_02319200 [Mycena venus]|uniref:Uncharacterized protein n=1 Tax=Mycena venus TaxID=2733690 RepID=A0A8H6X4D5_9AGAR|nr:hypothetical protein MVEN_02319200 [Mycena venus]
MIRRSPRLNPPTARAARQARRASMPAPPFKKQTRASWPASIEAARRAAAARQRESRAERFRKSLLAGPQSCKAPGVWETACRARIRDFCERNPSVVVDEDLPSLMSFASRPITGLNDLFPVSPVANRGTPINPARRAAWATVSPMPAEVAKHTLAVSYMSLPHSVQRTHSESMSLQHRWVNIAALFEAVRRRSSSFGYPAVIVEELEGILIQLYSQAFVPQRLLQHQADF